MAKRPQHYLIKVEGRLDESWSDWFSGLTITTESVQGNPHITKLTGVLPDQSVLRGILNRIWDLNLKLISVVPVDDEGVVHN